MTLLLTLFLSFAAQAKEEWFCTTQSSHVSGSSIEACGVGVGTTEARARLDAFDQANLEFQRVCGSHCAGEPTPMRTECEKSSDGFTCRRMLSFTMVQTEKGKAVVHTGKIKIGMAKSDALAILGSPDSISRGGSGDAAWTQLFYSHGCKYMSCWISVQGDKVNNIEGLSPSMQEL